MSDTKIRFSYEEKNYEVGMAAYDENKKIKLPSGICLEADGWLESYPPQPDGLKPIDGMLFVPEDEVVEAIEV